MERRTNKVNGVFRKLRTLYTRYRQMILYLFFGVCTTVINTVCYALLYHCGGVGNVASTIVAWFVAVLFAFVTNKIFVFESKRQQLTAQVVEFLSFFGFRLLTGILDVVIMAVAVDLMHWNGLLWKLLSNIIVTMLNYVASKFMIFKKK